MKDEKKVLDWIKINSENDLPEIGRHVITVRELGGGSIVVYDCGIWNKEDVKYWKFNHYVAYAYFNGY